MPPFVRVAAQFSNIKAKDMEQQFIAIKSESLSRNDARYVVIDRDTREVVDDCNGHGYKSPQAAHKRFASKQRRRSGRVPSASVRQQSSPAVTTDPKTGVTRVNSWSGFAPRRASAPAPSTASTVEMISPFVREDMAPVQTTAQRRAAAARSYPSHRISHPKKDVSQEGTTPPPDLFDFENR